MSGILRKILLKVKIETLFLLKRFDNVPVRREQINKNYIKKFLPHHPLIVDAGAHVGGDSIEMCRLYPSSRIHAFEPIPAIFSRLKHNTRKYHRITCYPLALSNRTGEHVMHVSSGRSDASSSLLRPTGHLIDHPHVYFNEDIKVETITLDDWAEKYNVHHVDLLWLDLQGMEMAVLESSKKIVSKVKAVHMEVSTSSTYEDTKLYPDVKNWMQQNGFRVEVKAIPFGWSMGNVLFVRS